MGSMNQAAEVIMPSGSRNTQNLGPVVASVLNTIAREDAMAGVLPVPAAEPVSERTELIVRIERRQGSVAKLLGVLADRGIRVQNRCSMSDTHGATVLMVTDQEPAARRVLDEAGLKYRAEPVVVVETAGPAGIASQLGQWLMMAGVGIIYSYGSRAGDDRYLSVFKTVDDRQAMAVLRERFATVGCGDGREAPGVGR